MEGSKEDSAKVQIEVVVVLRHEKQLVQLHTVAESG